VGTIRANFFEQLENAANKREGKNHAKPGELGEKNANVFGRCRAAFI
jgi:hypothetical protein